MSVEVPVTVTIVVPTWVWLLPVWCMLIWAAARLGLKWLELHHRNREDKS